MATVFPSTAHTDRDYPTRDGRPLGETPLHRKVIIELTEVLETRHAADPMVYVSGNIMLYYELGNPRRHVSPDVMVVFGIPKDRLRDTYLLWKEGKGPDFIIEATSVSTAKEDQKVKFRLYQDVLKVREYFLFDPRDEYLQPSLQGFRLQDGRYVAILPVDGRLPSETTGLHLEREGQHLRLYDPANQLWLHTTQENLEQAEAEVERLRRELEALRQRLGEG